MSTWDSPKYAFEIENFSSGFRTMDFTQELSAFQGTLIAADNKHSFHRLTSRGGNEDTISNIVQHLRQFLLDKQYCTSKGIIPEKCKSEIRKFCFYLVLNSDFPALEQVVELSDVGHLVWTTPTITACLFSEIIWGLRMESYVSEVISYGNPKLGVNILKVLVNGVRYCSAQDSVGKLRELSVACYRCLCRLSFLNYDNALTSTLLVDVYTYYLRCITHFVSPPNKGKLEESSEETQYLHLGRALRSLLGATKTCLEIFESPLNFSSHSFDELYLSTVEPASIKTMSLARSVAESSDTAVLEYVEKCNIAVVDKCVELVMMVSVDVFCLWSEHMEDGCSLQRSIAELAYILHEKLKNVSSFSEHMIMVVLPGIAIKPADIFDVIKEADDETLIANVHLSNEDREHWLNALIERRNLYESEPLMTCLQNHLSILNPEMCESLFRESVKYLRQNNDIRNVKVLAADSFVRVDPTKKLDLISEFFSDRLLHDTLETPDFDKQMNESFNKLISSFDSNLSEIYDIFLQNPRKAYDKMLSVGVENVKQASLMVKAFAMLKDFSEYCWDGEKEPAILNAIEELCAIVLETEVQENSFLCLLSGLCKEIVSLKNCLLLKIVMPYVHKSVVNRDFKTLRLHLRLLKRAYDLEQLTRYRAPLLAMLGQVLAVVRWDFTTYTSEAPTTLQDAIDLHISLFSTYKSVVPEKDANWLKTKIKRLQPLNMFYFKEIWNPPGKNFVQVLINAESVEEEQYPIILAKILNCCTQKEWVLVWQSLIHEREPVSALELMYQSLVVMTVAENSNRTDNSWACIQYCYRCFTTIVKEHFLTDTSDKTQLKHVLEKFVDLANATSEEDIQTIGDILLPLLASIVGNKQQTEDISYVEITNKLKHGNFAKVVQEVLANVAT